MKSVQEIVSAAKEKVCEIDTVEAQNLIEAGALLVDVREPDEYRAGHIPGAFNIPRGLLEFKIQELQKGGDPSHPICLYCKSGSRAALSFVALTDMGFQRVYSLEGGVDNWESRGLPIGKP